MNEFVRQFLLESREHVEQATADLLALEQAPGDKERLDSAFRAFHTLKGGAGIVDFYAMGEAIHAAEGVLEGVRSGKYQVDSRLIGDCLMCLDQVVLWLDATERAGDVPKNAQGEAALVVKRFGAIADHAPGAAAPESRPVASNWPAELLTRHSALRTSALTGLRYAPDPGCFFEGDDPLARIAALPGLLAVEVVPALPWPPLGLFDPFSCNLVITALTRSSHVEVEAAMGDAMDCCEIRDVGGAPSIQDGHRLGSRARDVLAAQLALMGDMASGPDAAGRLASAGVVAANVLRNAGNVVAAEQMARSTEIALASNDSAPLRRAIQDVMGDAQTTAQATSSRPIDQATSPRTVRVDASRIDALASLTGELSVAKNSIDHVARLVEQGAPGAAIMLRHRLAVLDRLVGELQRSVLGMRVLALRHVFQRFPRLLREMSVELGKHVSLVVEGGETEADKVIVEMLFEPLLHVLRNAIDHGIEDSQTRVARGKPRGATIRLSAHRQGEHVVIDVSDDGRGIDVAQIRQMALRRGIRSDEAINAMDDEAVLNIIFEPGFSTATAVTALSGRGVGMDSVRAAVQRVGGHVDIESRVGQGTTVRFTLPFSVMVTRVMVVTAAEQNFAIPIDLVVETLRLGSDKIIPIGGGSAIVLRNRTIPVIALGEALGLPPGQRQGSHVTFVVAKINGDYGALLVDRIGQRMDVVLEPLDGLLAGMRGVTGTTVDGDGTVLLILDLGELLQ